MDCIEIVKLKFGIGYRDALQRILNDRESLRRTHKVFEKEEKYLEFILGDLQWYEYFHKLGIASETLAKFKVFPAKVVYCNEEIIARGNKSNPLFVYLMPSGNIKTYRPLAKDPSKKWGGNANAGDIAGIQQLPKKGKILFITSSLKDVMQLYELGYNAIAFNGEGYGTSGESAKIMKQTISKLELRFEHIIFYMDNDVPGLRYNNELSRVHHKKWIANPNHKPKDLSDYVAKYGIHNGRRLIKRLLAKQFNLNNKDGFLEFIERLNSV